MLQISGLVLALLLLPASAGTTRATGVHGKAVIAGQCGTNPLVRAPLDVQITVRRGHRNRRVRTVRSGRDGVFKIHLRPGRYRLEPGGAGSFALPPRRVTVTVRSGRLSRVAIVYRRVCAPPPPAPKPGVPGATLAPATDLHSKVGCTVNVPRQPVVDLSWTPASGAATEQRVAVTIYRDGFETGKFDSSEPLGAVVSTLEWRRLSGQAIHFWRVLTRYGETWVASASASFEGPLCVIDNAGG